MCAATGEMPAVGDATEFVPAERDLETLREASCACRGCDLYEAATQTVFGEGRATASIMLVGEQPGDYEDREGKPFVGPAGRLLDEVLDEVGIDRDAVYVTNAVKHFKFEYRGKRRIHSKPNARQIRACRPWLTAELEAVRPAVVVCLGATAAQALLGPSFRVTQQRGQALRETGLAPVVVATVHPASILRAQDDESRQEERAAFVADMRQVRSLLETR